MKRIVPFFLVSFLTIADTETYPPISVVISTETVTKTVAREPRMIVLQFSPSDGSLTAEVSYETVTRVNGGFVASVPFRSVSLTWQQITNLVPALATSLDQFKVAARASLTNAP